MGLSQDERRMMQRKGLELLVAAGQPDIKDPFYPYTNGTAGPYFMQSTAPMHRAPLRHPLIEYLTILARKDLPLDTFDGIAGGESRDWRFSIPLALELGLDDTAVYKNGRIYGPEPSGDILWVADLNRTASSFFGKGSDVGWIPAVEQYGGRITHALFFVDRNEGGRERLEQAGIQTHALVTMGDAAFDQLHDMGRMPTEKRTSLQSYLQDPEGWGHRAVHENIDHLYALLAAPDTHAKAQKLLTTYGREELLDTMVQAGHNIEAFDYENH